MKSPTDTIYEQVEAERLLELMLRRMSARVLGLTLGGLCATGLFVATNWLVLKGGPNVGTHLSLLHYYFPFYSVSFGGSLIGAVYGFLVGFLAGMVVSRVYNLVANLRAGPPLAGSDR